MRIKNIHIEKFKRFTELTIEDIPETAKLVVLVGPNGCGKSSLFDAFKAWHLFRGYNNGVDNDYCKKDWEDGRQGFDLVSIDFYEKVGDFTQEEIKLF